LVVEIPLLEERLSCIIPLTMTKQAKTVTAALSATTPVFFGYTSIGFAFGFLLVRSGMAWYWSPIMGIFIFAGAAQFLAIGLLGAGTSPIEMGLAVLLLNARHAVYGFSLLDRFSHFRRFKLYLIFGLTDETYALLTTVKPPEGVDRESFDFLITLFNQLWWVIGSTAGALFGTQISWDAPGIEFALTALFVVLLVEQIRSLKRPGPFLIALISAVLLNLAGCKEQTLLVGILISTTGCFFLPQREDAA
jgi:4-azaleucine resistance transporter AzlC